MNPKTDLLNDKAINVILDGVRKANLTKRFYQVKVSLMPLSESFKIEANNEVEAENRAIQIAERIFEIKPGDIRVDYVIESGSSH